MDLSDATESDADPEQFVEENREQILTLIRRSDDPFTRAAAWTLLDRYTPDNELDDIEAELKMVADRRGWT
jgi:predicted Zn-ribbon and HTH transcriptional regulator